MDMDREALKMANAAEERKSNRRMQRNLASTIKRIERAELLRFWRTVLIWVLVGLVSVDLAIYGQVAGWIANVGVCVSIVAAAIVIDRRYTKR